MATLQTTIYLRIEINHEYAKRYDYHKKREDLQKLEELKKHGRVDSNSEESSSEEKKDPILFNKDAKLFDSEDEDDSKDAGEVNGEKKKKPMHLITVIANQLIEYGVDFNDDGKMKTYSEEKLVEVSKDYFRSRMWVDDVKSKDIDDDDDEIEVSEDEEEIEWQKDYERDFNFRYEENAGDRILGHSRRIEGSVMKKEKARKFQRDRKEERMIQAEFERKEELKRLKNLKKKEINEKLEKIREVAGIGKNGGVFLDDDDLEGEFDPEAYDRKMKEAFGDGYYDAKNADPGFGSDDENEEKPDFDKEDELLGLEKERVDVIDEGKRKRKRKPSEVEKAVKQELLDEYYKFDYEGTIGDLKTRFKYRQVKKRKFGSRPEDVLMLDDKELNEYVSLKKVATYREQKWKVPRVKTVQLKLRGEVRKEKGKAAEKSESKGEMGNLSRKVHRRRRQAELKLSQYRLMAYGKIRSKAKSKKKQ
ncbi:hypothetical protein CASFOL_016253 [Castilleja foliolosa]|uniref:Kri1-like C-terminal domain-containing protein n=1 Tax=Castilleja foliolosa TaxID=1961234 RepID=A0ABD3DG21_9LAMI